MPRVTFHITEQCNMACTYCYEHKHNKVIDINDAKSLIDEIIKYLTGQDTFLKDFFSDDIFEDDNRIELDFIGGEITLYMDLVSEITDYFFRECAKHKLVDMFCNSDIVLQTNGTTYFNNDVQKFLHKWKDKIDLPITIDGCKECHDSCRHYLNGDNTFDDINNAVEAYIKDTGNAPNSKITFTAKTLKYILPSCQHMYDLGYTYVRMNTDVTTKLTLEESNEYYNELVKVADWIVDNRIKFLPSFFTYNFTGDNLAANCGMTGAQIALDADGYLYNCFRFSESSMQNKARPIGNIREKCLDRDFIEYYISRTSAHNNPKCIGCPILHACEECPVTNYLKNGFWFNSYNNCGETVAEAKAQKYLLDRVRETNYPYFHEYLDKVENMYDPNFKYLLYQEAEEQELDAEEHEYT